MVISSHLLSCINWWGIWGGKSCHIDTQHVDLSFRNHLASKEQRELTGDDVDEEDVIYHISIILRRSSGFSNVILISYSLNCK